MPVVTLTYLSYAGSNGNVQADSATQKFPLRRQNFLSCSLHSREFVYWDAVAVFAAGSEIAMESGWVQIAFPLLRSRRFMVALRWRRSTSTSR